MSDINPNSDKNYIDNLDLSDARNFPQFLKSVEFNPFRHIPDLKVDFLHPISVISGTNRSGKSTILMTLACSHIEFKKRDIGNGNIRRHTWSDLMLFTKNHDKQTEDWIYHITYKLGNSEKRKKGYRKHTTKKWGGIGHAKSQFKDRQVVFIDMDRTLPARNYGGAVRWRANVVNLSNISTAQNQQRINYYISYILEETFILNNVVDYINKSIYKYSNSNEYSSYNAASGEDVLSKIIIELVEAKNNSLILIDEIEIGLHPKVQRRLMQVIYHIAREDKKQFIITTHSPSILSSAPDKARIFIEKSYAGNFKAIPNISINAALSKMDSESYPLINLFCEDDIAHFIIDKAISKIQTRVQNFSNLVNIIEVGSADKTYNCFRFHKDTYEKKKVRTGYACILDGDMRTKKDKNNNPQYPTDDYLHFIYSDLAPEKFLVDEYEKLNPNTNLRYHINDTNCHSLFDKMNELSQGTTRKEAFEICWNNFISTSNGEDYFRELQQFIIDTAKKFSPDL